MMRAKTTTHRGPEKMGKSTDRVRQILSWYPSDNPGTFALGIRKPKAEAPEIQVLDPDQLAQFLKAAETDRLFAYYVTALDSGARPGESFRVAGRRQTFDHDLLGAWALGASAAVAIAEFAVDAAAPRSAASPAARAWRVAPETFSGGPGGLGFGFGARYARPPWRKTR